MALEPASSRLELRHGAFAALYEVLLRGNSGDSVVQGGAEHHKLLGRDARCLCNALKGVGYAYAANALQFAAMLLLIARCH